VKGHGVQGEGEEPEDMYVSRVVSDKELWGGTDLVHPSTDGYTVYNLIKGLTGMLGAGGLETQPDEGGRVEAAVVRENIGG
jgi:hypothetical protein